MENTLEPTPSQTVGPFYGYALPFPGGEEIVPPGEPGAVVVRGTVFDGAGTPVPDAIIEVWQPGPDGSLRGAPGSLRRDPVTGGVLGRTGLDFTGFGRAATDADGHWYVRTLPPGPHREGAAPHLSVCVFARGLLHHLYTRVYLPEDAEALAADPLLAALPPQRRDTLIAGPERPGVYRFDLWLQGGAGEETVFLEFA
ncbi:protocatechuate 3,4-dioxygenase subunit alpha [Actinocorallia populi]|uniref:protocatechuate 3,4-dioxygenase subunit alpha n=1 Tax=Actinocorallia populi TaxID=2079200 RepID=UPI000D093211|nr:protocatechuate 3,4-dioxygenase subunit alpha [Actinocorallia populi]